MNRWDETWHRLLEWTNDQAPSERLAAQILLGDGYTGLDPSHPLGGRDGMKDAVCSKDGRRWVMAVYFPRGQQPCKQIEGKFKADFGGVAANRADAFVFVTNQELRLAEREALIKYARIPTEIYHLERITAILDQPAMASVRQQFLGISIEEPSRDDVVTIRAEIVDMQRRLEGVQTGGDSFCYWMLYHFDLEKSVAYDYTVIRRGDFPLYDLRFRIHDMDTNRKVEERQWGELNSPADFLHVKWQLPVSIYYRIFFHARNGGWHQDLILQKSLKAGCWLASTIVTDTKGRPRFKHEDSDFVAEFGEPAWRS